MHASIRCKKCVLPHTYPDIQFNDDSICNFCLDYSKENKTSHNGTQRDLESIIKDYKGKSNKYDVIV